MVWQWEVETQISQVPSTSQGWWGRVDGQGGSSRRCTPSLVAGVDGGVSTDRVGEGEEKQVSAA